MHSDSDLKNRNSDIEFPDLFFKINPLGASENE
jgi:hypothetical protein